MIESLIADAWLDGVLSGDATLSAAVPGGWHADVAPEETASPWGVWFQLSALDAVVVGAAGRIVTDLVYEVRVTGRNVGYGALRAAAERVDALLGGQKNVTVTGLGLIVDCVRREPVRFSEQDAGQWYRHLGGQYAIKVQAAN